MTTQWGKGREWHFCNINQGFSNCNVHRNHLGFLFQFAFCFGGSGEGPEMLHFLISSQGMLMLLVGKPTLGSKGLVEKASKKLRSCFISSFKRCEWVTLTIMEGLWTSQGSKGSSGPTFPPFTFHPLPGLSQAQGSLLQEAQTEGGWKSKELNFKPLTCSPELHQLPHINGGGFCPKNA